MNVHGPKHGERNSEERQKRKKEAKGLDRTTGISVLGEFDLVVEELSSQVILRQVKWDCCRLFYRWQQPLGDVF